MTSGRKKPDPKKRAIEILAEFGIRHWPVAVDSIARRKGILIRYVPLDPDLSGMIFVKETTVVVINSLHPPSRQRFTLAHELGHFELHMRDIGSEVHVDKKFLALARDAKSSMGWDWKEVEANRFAGELLVPQHFLIQALRGRVIDAENEGTVTKLAGEFKVSPQMMIFRIGELLESRSS